LRGLAFAFYRSATAHFFNAVPHPTSSAIVFSKGRVLRKSMRALRGVLPVVVSVGLILAVTAILWRLRLTTRSSHGLVYIYLFPVVLIAALYNGPLAVLSTVIALLCADFFLEARLYSFVDDNPLEYGDLFVFVILAVTAIKFIRVLMRPRTSLGPKSRSA
jgi:K+-sensing histidine kinase KdpD